MAFTTNMQSEDDDGGNNFIARTNDEVDLSTEVHNPFPQQTLHTNIEANYKDDWGAQEAFREFLQNFEDGILDSFNVTLQQLDIKCTEILAKGGKGNGRIEIRYSHPTEKDDDGTTKKLLGYILFVHDPQNLGVLYFCNFQASLYARHFKMGRTTKRQARDRAGGHGEGAKLAALAARRYPQNHSVKFSTSSHYINFGFNTNQELIGTARPVSIDVIRQQQAKFKQLRREKKPRPLENKVWEDVCVEIGAQRTLRDEFHNPLKTSKIHIDDFRKWLEITTHINPPKQQVCTPHGTLILDPAYKHRLFLRGLELPNTTRASKKYQFGYDFLAGRTNRDREFLRDTKREAKMVTNIWSHATKREPNLTADYCDLLLAIVESRSTDVLGAEDHMDQDFIERIGQELKVRGEQADPKLFYYCDGADPEEPANIIKHLSMEPRALPATLWKVLHDVPDKFIKSFSEHREDVFRERCGVNVDNPFANHMKYLLRSCLLADPATEDKSFQTVNGSDLGLKSHYFRNERLWKLDVGVFDIDKLREWVFCDIELVHLSPAFQEDFVFLWDRAVAQVHSLIIAELSEEDLPFATKNDVVVWKGLLEGKIAALLSTVPRGVSVKQTQKAGELEVAWESVESKISGKRMDEKWRVTLHRVETCRASQILEDPLHDPGRTKVCECPHHDVTLDLQSVTFKGLDPQSEYFPLVSRTPKGAIFGFPPDPCCPRAQSHDLSMDDADEVNEPLNNNEAASERPSTTPVVMKIPASRLEAFETGRGSSELTRELPHHMQASQSPAPGARRLMSNAYEEGATVEIEDIPWRQGFPGQFRFTEAKQHGETVGYIARKPTGDSGSPRKRQRRI